MRFRVALIGLVLVGCSSPAADPTTTSTSTSSSAPATVTSAAVAIEPEVYAPEAMGEYPVAVIFHGGGWFGGSPLSTVALAEYLAENDVVVFNSTYRTSNGGGYPESFDDVACAIRDATELAAGYTTTPDDLTVIAHSAGAHLSAVVALSLEVFGGECAAGVEVDRFVGLSGVYDPTLYTQLLATFFHSRFENDPAPWEAGSPYTYIEDNPELSFLLLHGDDDQLVPVSSSSLFAEALEAADHEVTLEVIPGGDHQSTRQPDPAGPLILDFLRS